MNEVGTFESLLARLSEAEPLDLAQATLILDGVWQTQEEASEFFTLHKGVARAPGAAGIVQSVEIRVAKHNRSSILFLKLTDKATLTGRQLIGRHPDAQFVPASASAPPTAPHCVIVEASWGHTTFGIARDGSDRVVSVLLDSTP